MSKTEPERRFPADPKKYPVRTEPTCCYSELQVMRSNAGWYIGREAWDEEWGHAEPGSRESGYYATREEAAAELKSYDFSVRECLVENDHAYETGALVHPKDN